MKTLLYSIALIFVMMACSKEEPVITATDNSGDVALRCAYTYSNETAFAKLDSGYNSIFVFYSGKTDKANPVILNNLGLNTNRWGWASKLKPQEDPYPFKIYAAAGLNNINKGGVVGNMYVYVSPNKVDILCHFYNVFTPSEIHLFVSPNQPTNAAPGQYGFDKEYTPGVQEYFFTFNFDEPLTDGVWVIGHFIVSGTTVWE